MKANANLTRDDANGTTYSCGDYFLYQCDHERPNMIGWILRFDGELIGYPRTVAEARQMVIDRSGK